MCDLRLCRTRGRRCVLAHCQSLSLVAHLCHTHTLCLPLSCRWRRFTLRSQFIFPPVPCERSLTYCLAACGEKVSRLSLASNVLWKSRLRACTRVRACVCLRSSGVKRFVCMWSCLSRWRVGRWISDVRLSVTNIGKGMQLCGSSVMTFINSQ